MYVSTYVYHYNYVCMYVAYMHAATMQVHIKLKPPDLLNDYSTFLLACMYFTTLTAKKTHNVQGVCLIVPWYIRTYVRTYIKQQLKVNCSAKKSCAQKEAYWL